MYTHLAQFIIKLRGIFVESQLVKIFLFNIDKKFLDFVTSRIILNYNSKAILAQAFVEVENQNKVLCQHDTTNMVAKMMDVFKPEKVATAISRLAKIQPKRTKDYWRYSNSSYTKNDSKYTNKKKVLHMEKFKLKAKMAKEEIQQYSTIKSSYQISCGF